MKFVVSFLIFLLTLLLVLMVSLLSCSTTQLLVFHFLFPLFSIPPLSTGIIPSDWNNLNIIPDPKSKTSSSSPSDYHPISLLSLSSKILSLAICMNFVLLTTFFLIVSLISDRDLNWNSSIIYCQFLVFFTSFSKMQSMQFSLILLKHLTLSLTSPY